MTHLQWLTVVLIPVLALMAGTATGSSEEPSTASLSASDYARAEQLLGWNAGKLVHGTPVVPQWIQEPGQKPSDRFWYRTQVEGGHQFIYVDPSAKLRRPAFDHSRLASVLSTASGRAYEQYLLPFEKIELRDGASTLRFWENRKKPDAPEPSEEQEEEGERDTAHQEDSEGETKTHYRWSCKLDDYTCEGPDNVPPKTPDEVESPDGKWVAFARSENLWLRELESGEEVQLSKDGEEHWGYAAIGQGCCDEITSRRAETKRKPPIFWSPDSSRLATTRLDERQVAELHLLETASGRPVLHSYRYPLPGDEHVPTLKWHVFEVAARAGRQIESPDIELFWPGEEDVRWSDDGQSLFFVHLHRGNQKADLYRADTVSGESRVLFEETSDTFLELNMTFAELPDWRVTGDGKRLVWRSERDGWGHLYLYDADSGALIRRLTSGAWSAARLVHLDDDAGTLTFHGYGREPGINPHRGQLYAVRLEDGRIQRLTPEDSNHEVHAAESGRFFVDTHSGPDAAPVTVVRDAAGDLVQTVESSDLTDLRAAGWTAPEEFVVKSRDGVTDLYGLLFKPSDFDPENSYPLIDYIYPGPQVGAVRTWGFTASPSGSARALAELGFLVMQINATGTPFRSKSFHAAWYGDMEDNGLADHVTAIKQLAARRGAIDLERIGIYGHSGGGFSSTDAMLRYPDFFRVAVSGAGNHDQRSYSYDWGEKYQGLLVKGEKGDNYDSQANHLKAQNLRGKLLLTYGTLDDNVHPNATLLLVDELIKHNKDFDMLAFPNRNHGYAREPYVVRRTWDYFVEHLLGAEPPREYRIEPPQSN